MLVAKNVGLKRNGNWAVRNVSFSGKRGELIGILGPSGTGKSTLIHALLGERSEGSVHTSGRVVYVPQDEMLWELLTPRETLEWAAVLGGGGHSINLGDWGLDACGDIRVNRLSGGQRRRLSIAVAEASHPSVLVLDEPTSGLDAATARHLMNHLTLRGRDRLTLAAIHQPSDQVFKQFDSMLLITHGQPVYFGQTRDLHDYMCKFGFRLEQGETTAELALRAINDEFGNNVQEVVDMIKAWVAPEQEDGSEYETEPEVEPVGSIPSVIARTAIMQLRDHPRLGLRGLASGLGGVLLGVVYWGSRVRVQRQILPRVWIVLWLMALPANLSAVTAWATTAELARVTHERNLYRTRTWLTARSAVDLMVAAIVAIATLGPAAYAIANFKPHQGGPTWVVTTLMLWAFDGLAELSGCMADPLNAVLVFMSAWFGSFLFSGMLVSPDQMPMPLPFLRFLSPFFYAGRSIVRMEMGSNTYAGAHNCPSCLSGFACDSDIPASSCYGHTGAQVMWSLHQSFSSAITNESTIGVDILGLILIGGLSRLTLLFIMRQSRFFQKGVGCCSKVSELPPRITANRKSPV